MTRHVSYRPGAMGASTVAAIAKAAHARSAGAASARTRKVAGGSKESLFDRTHERYALQDRAVVVHLHPPVAGPPTALRYTGDGHVDYLGVLGPAMGASLIGRAIAFDVKGCTGHAKLAFDKPVPMHDPRYKRVERDRKRLRQQGAFLASVRRMGGLAAFLCVDTERGRCWIVTDVERIAGGDDVPFRHRDRDLFPSVPIAQIADLARGAVPLDYLSVWPL